MSLGEVEEFESITGKGVTASLTASRSLGNLRLLASLDIDGSSLLQRAEELRAEAQTVMFVAVDSELAGLVSVS